MNFKRFGRKHYHFPQHYKNIIESCGISKNDIANKCNISNDRFKRLLNPNYKCAMDNAEFKAIQAFIDNYENN